MLLNPYRFLPTSPTSPTSPTLMSHILLTGGGSGGTSGSISYDPNSSWAKGMPIVSLGTASYPGFSYAVWSKDGKYFAAGDNSGSTPVTAFYSSNWSKLPSPATMPSGNPRDAAFTESGDRFVVVAANAPTLCIYDTAPSPWLKTSDPATLPSGQGQCCAFSSLGKLFVGFSTTSRVYNTSDLSLVSGTPAALNNSAACDFNPSGTMLVVINTFAPRIRLFETTGWTQLTSPPVDISGNVTAGPSAKFSPDGNYFAVAVNVSPYLEVFETSGWTKITIPVAPASSAQCVSWSVDGKYLCVLDSQRTIIYDTATWAQVLNELHNRTTPKGAFSPYLPKREDRYYANLISNLRFTGADLSTTIQDDIAGKTWTAENGASLTTDDYNFRAGGSALEMPFLAGARVISTTNVADSFGTGPFTIRAVMKILGPPVADRVIFDTRSATSNETKPTIQFTASNGIAYTADNTNLITATQTFTTEAWYDLAVTRDSSNNLRMFINGVQVGSTIVDARNYANDILCWGNRSYDSAANPPNVILEECQVYKGVALYTTTFTPPGLPRPSGPVSTAMTYARYWRLDVTANDGNGSYIGATEIELREEIGGEDVTVPADAVLRASASSIVDGTNSADKAFDGGMASGWLSAVATPSWIQWDFGVDNSRNITQIAIRGSWDTPTASPKDFTLQRSNDGVSWTTVLAVTGQTGWTAGEHRNFAV